MKKWLFTVSLAGILTITVGCGHKSETSASVAATETDTSTSSDPAALGLVPPPPVGGVPVSTTQISYPEGDGQLLPAWRNVQEVEKQMQEEGLSWDNFRDLQTLREDIPSEVPFVNSETILDRPTAIELSNALVPVDNIVIVEFIGNTCARTVGGYAYVEGELPIVVLFGGELQKPEFGMCYDKAVRYRLILWMEGVGAGAIVQSTGGTVEASSILLPMKADLAETVITADKIPFYSGN